MGWLLSCRQAYAAGINVLYATNTFHFTNTELILNIPKLVPSSNIGMISAIEMRWKIHPFRSQDAKDPPLSDYEAFLMLVRETPRIFYNLRRLYVSLQGDLFLPGEPEGFVSEAIKFEEVEEKLIRPLEGMLRKLQKLEVAVIAVPSSVYKERKRRAMSDGTMITEWRYYCQERHWRPLQDASVDGYWIALGHRDL